MRALALLALLAGCPSAEPTPGPTPTPTPEPIVGSAVLEPQTAEGANLLHVGVDVARVSLVGVAGQDVVEIGLVADGVPEEDLLAAVEELTADGGTVRVVIGAAPEDWPLLEVRVTGPEGLDWAVVGAEADVSASDLGSGSVQLDAGTVDASGGAGGFDAAIAGACELTLEFGLEGPVNLGCGEGPMELTLPADTDATLVATTGDGEVVIDGLTWTGANADGTADGVLGAGGAAIDLETGSGDITLLGL